MKRVMTSLTLILGLGFGTQTAYAQDCSLYAFGDSLSDIGTTSPYSAFAQSGGLEPPSIPPSDDPGAFVPIFPPEGFYSDGRFSDGKVWVEFLKNAKCPEGALISFARGGAFSDNRNANADIDVFGGLQTQVFEDLDDVLGAQGRFYADDIITVWAFSNNVVFDLLMVNPVQAVDDVTDATQHLASRGAKTILIANAPAIGDTPFGQFLAQQAFPGLPNNLNARVTQYNNMLRIAVAALNETLDANVVYFDINTLFRAMLTDPGDHGFVNVTVPCMIQDDLRVRVLTGACPVEEVEPGVLVLNATGTAFYDVLHPTTVAHQRIAEGATVALGTVAPAQTASAR